jgi:hypothetical protein
LANSANDALLDADDGGGVVVSQPLYLQSSVDSQPVARHTHRIVSKQLVFRSPHTILQPSQSDPLSPYSSGCIIEW